MGTPAESISLSTCHRISLFSTTNEGKAGKKNSDGDKATKAHVSQLKNPIVHQLWMAREHAKEMQRQRCPTESPGEKHDLHYAPRPPSKSQTSISYNFATDDFLRETYQNPWGQMRFGRILEDLDALAGNIAFSHVQDPTMNIVTASVDRIHIRSPPNVEVDQHLEGQVTFVGRSSMEIRMSCKNDHDEEWLEAYFTFVATDPETHRPVSIPPLSPETPTEKARFVAGERRAAHRKAARKANPTSTLGMLGDPTLEQQAQALLQEAGPLLNMPSLADPNSILMMATRRENAEIAQPQVRNLANRIFGGFLMRRAFELAYATCYVFGGARPRFVELDEVSFQSPVNVGDLTIFNSKVLYTELCNADDVDYDLVHQQQPTSDGNTTNRTVPVVTVHVEAWIVEPTESPPTAKLSNTFYFTFVLPDKTQVRKVLPSSIDEARSMVRRIAADAHQRREDKELSASSSSSSSS